MRLNIDGNDLSFHGKILSDLGAHLGGRARADTLSPQQLSKIGQHAANTRWGNMPERAGIKRKSNGSIR